MPPPRGWLSPENDQIKTLKATYRHHAYKRWEFRKNCAYESLLRGKFMAKIRNFDSIGGSIPTFLSR